MNNNAYFYSSGGHPPPASNQFQYGFAPQGVGPPYQSVMMVTPVQMQMVPVAVGPPRPIYPEGAIVDPDGGQQYASRCCGCFGERRKCTVRSKILRKLAAPNEGVNSGRENIKNIII